MQAPESLGPALADVHPGLLHEISVDAGGDSVGAGPQGQAGVHPELLPLPEQPHQPGRAGGRDPWWGFNTPPQTCHAKCLTCATSTRAGTLSCWRYQDASVSCRAHKGSVFHEVSMLLGKGGRGADDFLPVLIWVVTKATPRPPPQCMVNSRPCRG